MSDNTSNKRTAYLVIIFLLLLVNFVGAYFLFTGNKQNEDLTVENQEIKTEYTNLQQDFNNQLMDLNAMKGKNASLDSIIAIREAEIKTHLGEIDKWKKDAGYNYNQLKKAKASILAFEEEKISFQHQLDSLFSQNEDLKEIQVELETNLATEKEAKEALEVEKEYLDEKFELGSLLQADELYAVGVNVKDNGVEKEVAKINKADKMVVCYQTGVNKVREAGPVNMQLRIVNPAGETMYMEEAGSGEIVSKENGEPIRYTNQASFEFDGSNKKICLDWSHGFDQSGTYKAFIYQEGYLVGETSLTMK